MPPASALSMIANEAASSHCSPNVIVPRHKRETCNPVRPRRTLLSKPHLVELLVQEVARRDRPAAELRAVRHDAVPDERIEVMRFVVEQALLELADELLALLGLQIG